ncbi:MAG: RDD family protein [Tissierellia bacterium]|nr:RDD family protein [Tissierellia bacterium]
MNKDYIAKEPEEIVDYKTESDDFEYDTYIKSDGEFNQSDPKEEYFSNYPKIFFAGGFIRLIAFAIDSIIISAIRTMVLNIFSLITNSNITVGKGGKYEIISLVITLLYFSILTYLNRGQTLGKMIMGIRVVNYNGERPEFTQTIIRELFMRYIHMQFPVFYVMIVFHPKKQSLSDIICDSYVLNEKAEYAFEFGKRKSYTV